MTTSACRKAGNGHSGGSGKAPNHIEDSTKVSLKLWLHSDGAVRLLQTALCYYITKKLVIRTEFLPYFLNDD
jgi:hypothetical protein